MIEDARRAASADLLAKPNSEDRLLSNAYAHCVKMSRGKSAVARLDGIINEW
jgi:hypothetical protein